MNKRLRCRIGIHQWGKWSEPEIIMWGSFLYGHYISGSTYYRQRQTRTCECCGVTKERYITK